MINIIPSPLQYCLYDGTVYITASTIVTTEFIKAKNILEKHFSKFNGTLGASVFIVKDETLAADEYKLTVTDKNVKMLVGGAQAAIYGAQSLIQLAGMNGEVCQCDIHDKPRYKWRGFMLDSARHFQPIEHIKSILDVMGNLKLNIFHWHLTDDQGWRIEIKKYPLLAQKGCIRSSTQLKSLSAQNDGQQYGEGLFYSQDEIKDIVNYANNLGISVVPEIDMPGHLMSAISCYNDLSCEGQPVEVSNRWGVRDIIGCAGGEKLYEFVKDILDEVCALFPYEYFHIGGDEVPKTKWKNCPKCQAKIAELKLSNEEELQGYFNNFVGGYIKRFNKHLIGWNEILNATELDTETVIQWWTPSSGKAKVLNFMQKGGKVILSKHQNFYLDHSYAIRPLSKTYNFNYTMLGIKDDTQVLGVEAPQWTEYIREKGKFDFNTYPRMMALAENAWTQNDKLNYQDFEARLEHSREFFESMYNLKLANPFFYRGNSIKSSFFRAARAWSSWSKNPYAEYNQSKK